MTVNEIYKKIEESERAGLFDCHIDPIPAEIVIQVDENYHYVGHRTFFENLKYIIEKIVLVIPFTRLLNLIHYRTKYIGRENFKGLDAAVITCNHIQKFDCLAIQNGTRGHRTFVLAAPFNNMKGFWGEMMRAGDMVPMSSTRKGQIKFLRVVDDILKKRKKFLLVYPEGSMWRNYKKPRPYKDGSFRFAAEHGVPVVPQFITMTDRNKRDKEGDPLKKFTVHISKPIYPKSELSIKENTLYLKEAAFDFCKEVYEKTYGEKLTYLTEENHD